MSAELFLSSRLESAHALYGPIVDLTDQIHDLSHLDVLPAVQQHVEILWADLKAWWAAHPSHADLALFDSMSQLHDLACGESAVWLQTLTEDLVEHLRASLNQAPQQMTLLIDLGKQIYHLAHQRVEEQIPEVIWQLYEQIARLDAPTDGISTETSIRDTRPQLDAHLWGTVSSHFALVGEGSIKEALEHMAAVLAGERTAAMRMLAQEFLR
ncbi:MAG TPA: hypothetical protein VKR06_34740, partial [Ktedonosporobacter sp.]|nr:hypothetical protein [Ktedonosporobacter sp.]